MPALDDDVIAAIEGLAGAAGPRVIAVRSLGGAFARVPSDATAFAHRDAEAMVVCMVVLPEAATEADVELALVPWRTVAALGVGTYVNFQGSATDEDVAAAYPPATYARLAAVKRCLRPGQPVRAQPQRRARLGAGGGGTGGLTRPRVRWVG